MIQVRQQPVPIQPGREQLLTKRDRAGDIGLIKARRAPRVFRGFDNECGGVAVETVSVRLEPAEFGFNENESECIENPMRTEPDKPVATNVDRGSEMGRV